MFGHGSFRERLVRQRLTSFAAWRDRALMWCAAGIAGLSVVLVHPPSRIWPQRGFSWICQQSRWAPCVITPLGGVVVVYLTRRCASGSAGSGIPQVMSALNPALASGVRQPLRVATISRGKNRYWARLRLLAGFLHRPREGPSVQISASLMYAFRSRFSTKGFVHANDLMLAGGAAGIAAAFNAPLAGVVFAIEELTRRFEQRSSGLIVSSIVLAGVISVSLEGNFTYFGRLLIRSMSWQLLIPGLVCALAAGILGGVFSRVLIKSSAGNTGRIHAFRKAHPLAFAGLCGLIIAVLGVVSSGASHGSGYTYTREMLEGARQIPVLYVVIKFVATWLSFWSGVPGGIFAPSLAVGAGLGNDIAMLFNGVQAPLVALGMVGFLAAATQAPITAFIIVMEMIDGHAMVLSLMATALVANVVSKLISPPLYHSLSRLQLEALGVSHQEVVREHH